MWREILTDTDSSLVRSGVRALWEMVKKRGPFFPEPKDLELSWHARGVYRKCKNKAGEWIKDYSLLSGFLLRYPVEERFFHLALTEYASRDRMVHPSSQKDGRVKRELGDAFSAAKRRVRERYCQKLGKDPDEFCSQKYFGALERAAQWVHLVLTEMPFDIHAAVREVCKEQRPKIQSTRNAFYGNTPTYQEAA